MKVLVGFEMSGRVREAFRARGHYAVSVDLLPSMDNSRFHFPMDIREFWRRNTQHFDLALFYPPCTYLTVSGLHWNKRVPGRQALTDAALRDVEWLLDLPIEKICLENPVGAISTAIRKPDQIIQPWQFGHPESKQTCLWLKSLPLLQPTNILQPSKFQSNGRPQWDNQTKSGQNRLPPSADRALIRSLTYPGIAQAKAEQWG